MFLILGAAVPAAHAQTSIEEVIVTATKREESVQTLGLSVSAIQGEELQARGIVDFEGFATSIPNLAFGQTDDGVLANRTISIRGVSGVNTTSFYIDDIPLSESVNPLVLDVERVEVLRGPQGTLFGARGLGGTVRLITKQPEFGDEVTGRLHVGPSGTKESGSLNSVVDGALNIPLTDNLAIRVLGYLQAEQGYFDRVVGPSTSPGVVVAPGTPGALVGDPSAIIEDVGDKDTYGTQLAIRFEPSDALTASGRFMYQKADIDGFPLADHVGGARELSSSDLTQERLFDIEEGGEDEWYQFSLNLDYDTVWGTFISSTGYFTRETNEVEDSSEFVSHTLLGGALAPFGISATAFSSPIYQKLEFDTLAQELRFVSDFNDSPLEVTTGLFYQATDDDQAYTPENRATPAPGGAPFGDVAGVALGFFNLPRDNLIFTSDRDTDITELGVFGEFGWAFGERLSATFGARYFDTEVETEDFTNGFAAGGENLFTTSQSETGFNFKGLVDYEFNDDVFVYASVAEGFRIGGTNLLLPATFGCPAGFAALGFSEADTRTYDSDGLISYEAGAKTTWFSGRLVLNAAAFYIDFDDIQQRVLLSCGFSFTANLGEARSQGFELEMTAYPSDRLTLQAALGYTDAELTETVLPDVIDVATGAVQPKPFKKGDPLQQIPDFTLSASADYNFPISRDFEWFSRADFSYVGESTSVVNSQAVARIRPSYTLVNARLGLRSGVHEVAIFVNNLFDKDAVFSDNRNLAAESSDRPRVARNRPRTIGVDLRMRF